MDVQLSLGWLVIVSAVVLPAVVSLVTRRMASSGVKAVTLFALAIVVAAVQDVVDNGGNSFSIRQLVVTTFAVFWASVATHYGLLKPLAITGTNGAIAKALPGGIGRPVGHLHRH